MEIGNQPTIEEIGTGSVITWPWVGVEADCRYPRRERSGGWKFQVAVSFKGRPIHRSDPNLSSASGKKDFCRLLDDRFFKIYGYKPDEVGIDWGQIVEDFSTILIDQQRMSSPEVLLGEVEDTSEHTWLIDNLLVEGECNVIWAKGGTGKSMFALFLGTLMSENIVDSRHRLTVKPGNVLYADWEPTKRSMANRVIKIHAGLGISSESKIVYKHFTNPFSEEFDIIQELVHKYDIKLVIIDSLGLAMMGELSSDDAVNTFFRILKRQQTTSLVVTHANKQGEIFGSAFVENNARCMWEARKTKGSYGSGEIDFSLFLRKGNDIPDQKPQSWRMTFDDVNTVYTRVDTFDTDAAGDLGYYDLVYKTLRRHDGPMIMGDLEDSIISMKTGKQKPDQVKVGVSKAVSGLVKRDIVRQDGGGYVSLANVLDQVEEMVEEMMD